MKFENSGASRREFLRRTAAFSALGVAGPAALNMSALSRVAAATASDYKAIVCIFLYGGNDHYNTYVPYDYENHSIYKNARSGLAIERGALSRTILQPVTALFGGQEYALAPEFTDIKKLWDQQKISVLLNVGPLSQPTSKAEYENHSVPLPRNIGSHNDQQSVWQSLYPEGAKIGWGGRIADLFLSANTQDIFTGVTLAGDSVFLSGEASVQYHVDVNGSIAIAPLSGKSYGSAAVSSSIQQLIMADKAHLMKRAYVDITRRSIEANDALSLALAASARIRTPFSTGKLSKQLKMVAQMISARESLGMTRQIFFVGLGGFDSHSDMPNSHPPLLVELNDAMNSFYTATEELNIANQVTTFTASDFGRTLNGNGDGTDHGWGSHHMIMGGAINGREFHGQAPELGDDGPDDVGRGRLLPSTSVEQLGATLGSWFGCTDTELRDIFPAISEFNSTNLGFFTV